MMHFHLIINEWVDAKQRLQNDDAPTKSADSDRDMAIQMWCPLESDSDFSLTHK